MPLHTESIVYILLDDDNDNNTPPRNKRQKRRKKVQKIQAIDKNHIGLVATTKAIESILGGEQKEKRGVFFYCIN